jgi:predicted 2-oxoglutarate/Fe(II)-dependent dioxygenase YbiX
MNNFPTNVRDYVKIYHNVFSKDFCEQTIESLKPAQWHMHQFVTAKDELIYKGQDFMHTTSPIIEQEVITKALWNLINQYVNFEFSQFYEKFMWFDGWRGYTIVKFHRYDVNTDMKLHCDHIHDIFDGNRKGVPILTIVGLLNDDFEGGDFMLWEKEKIDLKQGSVLIFPSNFMYPHQVTSVLRGSRYSFVSWAW